MAQNYKGPLDYIDVATRIVEFRDKFPTGSLQQVKYEFVTVNNKDWIVYTAAAYRTPDDERPGIGTAQEYLPGKTAFTRGSEIQNLETSCWGRAIGALGIGIEKAIASREEVELAMERNMPETITIKRANPSLKRIVDLLRGFDIADKDEILTAVRGLVDREVASSNDLTDDEIEFVLSHLEEVSA
jgi:hypothetical protein